MSDPTPEPICPTTCPNRTSPNATRSGKIASYAFAIVVSLFLYSQVKSAEARGKDVSVVVWMTSLTFVGIALGVNVSPAAIGRIVSTTKPD